RVELQYRLALEVTPGGAELNAAAQEVVEHDVAKALPDAAGGQRRLELLAADPADLAAVGADAIPVGVAQLDLDPVVALRDEEDRKAAARTGAQFDVRIGDLQTLVARGRSLCRDGGRRRRGGGSRRRGGNRRGRGRGGDGGRGRSSSRSRSRFCRVGRPGAAEAQRAGDQHRGHFIGAALHWVLHVPVAGSGGVNIV